MFLLTKTKNLNLPFQDTPFANTTLKSCNYMIDDWNLKVFEDASVYHISKGASGGVLIGTPLYNGLSFEKILDNVLADFLSDNLSVDNLKGNFIFILWKEGNIHFVNDKLGVQSIFFDEINQRFSSSFLFLLRNGDNKFKINQNAFLEKLSTGFIIGSDTIVNGIRKILPNQNSTHPIFNNIHWRKHNYLQMTSISFHDRGRSNSINSQIDQLSSYFTLVDETFRNKIGDLGLSSGFDCRLILSLADKHIAKKLHLHSHNTKGVHHTEIKYAKELAENYDSELELIPTSRLETYDDNKLEEILTENLTFFDGISARHLGAFSETYTFNYKKSTLGNAQYSLNGLGGEVYRDSYFTGSKKMNWDDWINRYVFFPFSEESVGSARLLHNTSDYIRSKLEKQMDVNYDKMDMFSTHAYYGLIKMPQCNGSVASAYGKVSPFLMPFIEYDNIIEVLKAIPYLGIGGQYQAELIHKISPELAKVGSHYGFSFNKLSAKYLIWSKLKTLGSVSKRNNLVRAQLQKKIDSPSHTEILNFIRERKVLKDSKEVLLSFSPYTDFDKLLVESTQRRYIIYFAFMLKKLSDYIEK